MCPSNHYENSSQYVNLGKLLPNRKNFAMAECDISSPITWQSSHRRKSRMHLGLHEIRLCLPLRSNFRSSWFLVYLLCNQFLNLGK